MTRVCTCSSKGDYCKEVCACCYEEMREGLERLVLRVRCFQMMARNIFRLGREFWMTKIELGEYERASGDVLCTLCGIKYYDHPDVYGYPAFVVTCNGKIWKL